MKRFDSELIKTSHDEQAVLVFRWANRLMRAGIGGYERETRRHLAMTNIAGGLACLSYLTFVTIYSLYDFSGLKWVVLGNLLGALITGTIFFWHRFGPTVAGIVLAVTIYSTVFFFVSVLGRDSGIHLNYVGASAVVFVIFGLHRFRLILIIAAIGLALNIAAQMIFQEPRVPLAPWFVNCLYINSAVTIIGIVAFIVWFALSVAAEAEERSERLLRNVLPESIASRLKSNPDAPIADRFDEATVLFADLVGFTSLSNQLPPEKMVGLLNEIFCSFDKISSQLETEKIKTIGDAYMVVAGIPDPTERHAQKIATLAIGMLESINQISESSKGQLKLRVGIATGPITAGVIGKAKFAYDVWAPTVNLAARLQSYSEPEKIHVSDATKRALESDYDFERAPTNDMKGIGLIRTWYLLGEKERL